ncbi:MAG: NAD(P)-dependent oxidoreductase, partial [Tissierellia bacterium]|nr:NAD(P)-dependent oxidoreductase [Tissierellia bacterium]
GFYNRDIGIISYSKVAKELIKYLNNFKNNIWLYDPYIKKEKLRNLNIRKASLEDIFTNCDIISLHAPLIEDTRNMIRKEHFEMMKQNATFINTARGQIINQNDLLDVFKSRKDLLAVLDVTYPEPLPKDSELYKMKNVIISPHIAGSLGDEIQAMGELMYNELNNYLTAGNLEYEITEQQFKIMA